MWITRVSIGHPVFATMVMVALCVSGLHAYSKLGVEQMPDVSLPGAFVEVSYPGASPEAVEREVAAREKDGDRRCDIEAGMAKLLAARVAWSNADNALQIHGGNGYAQEYAISRVLCDARILNVFEGAAEIQAQVVARGLLSGRN